MAKLKPEFEKRNVKVIGLSVDPVDSHHKWAKDIIAGSVNNEEAKIYPDGWKEPKRYIRIVPEPRA